MAEDFSEKYIDDGKNRENRATLKRNVFDSLELKIKEPDTAVLLLKCKEQPILLSASAALSKFGDKTLTNLETLFDLKIVDNVIPLIEHDDIFTRRFAMKLLSQMTSIPKVKNYLLDTDFYVSRFCNLLTEESDVYMQEFSSRMLAELSKDLFGVEQLVKSLDVKLLFELMKSNDPDVERNCIEIVYNLLQDPFAMDAVVCSENFNFSIIYKLFHKPYQIIQELALDVIKCLMERTEDENIQDMFRATNGLSELFDLLKIDEWKDLHCKVLNIITILSENKKMAEIIVFNGGIQRILKYLEFVKNQNMYTAALKALISLMIVHDTNKLLYACEFADHLLEKLQDEEQRNNYDTICTGILRMSAYPSAAEYFTDKKVIPWLIDIAKNYKLDWTHRESALRAIEQLIKLNFKNCIKITGLKLLTQELLLDKTPFSVQTICLNIVQLLLQFNKFRGYSVEEYIEILYSVLDDENSSADELKIYCCDILSNICQANDLANDNKSSIFNAMKSHANKVFYLIENNKNPLPVINGVIKLLMQLCENVELAQEFVKNGCLLYMIRNRSSARVIPSWDTCIELLLDAHLPSKFAYSGRLTFRDITRDGFYAMRRTTCPFPDLEEFFKMKMCPVEAIYVINFCRDNNSRCDSREIDEARDSLRKESLTKGIPLSADELESLLKLRYGQMDADSDLCDYIDMVKCLISSAESELIEDTFDSCELVNVSKIVSRTKIIAEFVMRQMSGQEQSSKCIDYRANIHLQEIKRNIKRNVIPLGRIKVGSYFERALLFKVLADQILLPAVLARDEYGRAWIEVSVPQIQHSMDISTNCCKPTEKIFPKKLLRANYIVDLINYPGDLLPINSRKAMEYLNCEKHL